MTTRRPQTIGVDPVKVAQVAFLQSGGLVQAEIAGLLRVSQQTVSRYSSFIKGVCAGMILK